MPKIHLVLIDREKDYLDAVTNYILTNQSKRFRVSSFSKISYFNNFVNQTGEKIDVLLIDENMYDESFNTKGIEEIILLHAGMTNQNNENLHMVYRYKSGKEIIKSIIQVLSENKDNYANIGLYSTNTKVVAVYSPAGGVGKTSISLVSSTLCSNRGDEVLYLNFESFQSTPLFFKCNESENLSEVLYHIKNKSKNLSLKIEGIISTDPLSKVNYISPPESIIDINECTQQEVNILIDAVNHLNKYDYVFVDMYSDLDMKNISILSKSDQILLIITPDVLSILKAKQFLKDIEILSKRLKDNIIDKVSIIINKYNADIPMDIESLDLPSSQINLKIPKVSRIFFPYDNFYRVDMESEFTTRLRQYINHFIRSR